LASNEIVAQSLHSFMPCKSIALCSPTAVGALALGLSCLFLNHTAQAAERLAAQSGSRTTQWTVTYDGKPVMTYVFDPQKFKPYIQALNTLEGYGVLRDSPGDHLHHHGLMYAIYVNGINFWEETAGHGIQKVVETSPPQLLNNAAGLPEARLAQVLFWLSPEDAFLPNTNAPALLIERRTLTLTLNTEKRETALRWKSEFEVGSKTNLVTLTGSDYDGLGMRFLEELDPLAVHLTPSGPLDLSGGKKIVAPYPWEAVTFDLTGKPATIALFGAPGNAQGKPYFFAMKTPFAYLSATQNLDKKPLVYRAGEKFQINYLVTLYPELKSPDAINQRGQTWEATEP
jgi:hypothetical protein